MLATALAGLFAATPTAGAAVTTSNATASTAFGFADYTAPAFATRHVSATTDGAPGDMVHFICRGNGATNDLATVAAGAGGSAAADVPEDGFDSLYAAFSPSQPVRFHPT